MYFHLCIYIYVLYKDEELLDKFILHIMNSVRFPFFIISNHAWVSFHGFSEAYNEYATDMSTAISSYTAATGGL